MSEVFTCLCNLIKVNIQTNNQNNISCTDNLGFKVT